MGTPLIKSNFFRIQWWQSLEQGKNSSITQISAKHMSVNEAVNHVVNQIWQVFVKNIYGNSQVLQCFPSDKIEDKIGMQNCKLTL